MESRTLWARHGAAVRQASELGALVHMATASEERTDALLLCALARGWSQQWAEAVPDPRKAPEMSLEVMLPAHRAGRFAGRDSFRKTGYVRRSARV
jgi:hypothetical protein